MPAMAWRTHDESISPGYHNHGLSKEPAMKSYSAYFIKGAAAVYVPVNEEFKKAVMNGLIRP